MRTLCTAEDPYQYCDQRVGYSNEELNKEKLVGHISNSNAYKEAVEKQRLRRVNVEYNFATYAFNIFLDGASEPSGVSFQMAYAVSCHLRRAEQSKPRNWHTVLIAEKLPTGASHAMHQDMDDACFNLLVLNMHRPQTLSVAWDTKQTTLTKVLVLPCLHSLLMDDPQQKLTLACSSCSLCTQPNSNRASLSHMKTARTESNMKSMIQEAIEVIAAGHGSRTKQCTCERHHLPPLREQHASHRTFLKPI